MSCAFPCFRDFVEIAGSIKKENACWAKDCRVLCVGKMDKQEFAVLVTGANGKVGRALCEVFSQADCCVIATDQMAKVADLNADAFFQIALENFVQKEPLRRQFRDDVVEFLQERGVKLKGLVNNAAVQVLDHVGDLQLEQFEHTMRVNVSAPLMLTQLFLQELVTEKGAVVNIGSIHAKATKERFVSYATSKAALRGLTQAMAVDLGPSGITVNVIEPAALDTEMLREGFADNLEGLTALKRYHPIGRIGEAAEVAKLAHFLVSGECGFLTGAVIPLDGAIGARLHDPD